MSRSREQFSAAMALGMDFGLELGRWENRKEGFDDFSFWWLRIVHRARDIAELEVFMRICVDVLRRDRLSREAQECK